MDFRKLCSALRLLETQGNDARIADAQIIALLMERGPQSYEQLCAHLALSNSAVSRTVQRLSAINRKGKPGFGLVAVERDPREGRRRAPCRDSSPRRCRASPASARRSPPKR